MRKISSLSIVILAFISLILSFACSSGKPTEEKKPMPEIKPIDVQTEPVSSDGETDLLKAVKDGSIFKLLGKSFDKEGAILEYKTQESNKKNTPQKLESEKEISIKLTLNEALIGENFYNKSGLSTFPFDMESQIKDGLYAIIPRNPYTNQDVKSSFSYSPGDYLYNVEKGAGIFIKHCGKYEPSFKPDQMNYDKLRYVQYNERDPLSYMLTDGRSIYLFSSGNLGIPEFDIEILKQEYGEKYPVETARIVWLRQEMSEIISRYFQLHKELPANLDEIINYFGRVNPDAWINPYTKSPMVQMPKYGVSAMLNGDIVDIDRPEDLNEVSSEKYIQKYAGNFTYGIVKNRKGESSANLTFYFISREGNLEATYCTGRPMK